MILSHSIGLYQSFPTYACYQVCRLIRCLPIGFSKQVGCFVSRCLWIFAGFTLSWASTSEQITHWEWCTVSTREHVNPYFMNFSWYFRLFLLWSDGALLLWLVETHGLHDSDRQSIISSAFLDLRITNLSISEVMVSTCKGVVKQPLSHGEVKSHQLLFKIICMQQI